jgi:hypothetical protein
MKTTVEIADGLLRRSLDVVRREGMTLSVLVEEALRAALERRGHQVPYRWPDLSVEGDGVAPDIGEGHWETIRDWIYWEPPRNG